MNFFNIKFDDHQNGLIELIVIYRDEESIKNGSDYNEVMSNTKRLTFL